MDRGGFQLADAEGLAVGEQVAELGAVQLELGFQVEDLLEHALHGADALPDGDDPAQLPLQIGGGRQMVRMGVGFKQP
ncbi:hypothetical protein G6F61_015184 [Rhizopus arrhizus]|nr:hypothetical protein G6F61_015184 [Rhizopus arrhizus]